MFKNMTLAKAIIYLSLLGSIFLGWYGCQLSKQDKALRNALGDEGFKAPMPATHKSIQQLALEYTELKKELDGDGLADKAGNLDDYARTKAADTKAQIGDIDTNRSDSSDRTFRDDKLRVQPVDRSRKYTRHQISNFMYLLETGSRRVRVTKLKMQPVQTRLKDTEIPEDNWTFDIEVTTRERVLPQ